MMKMWYRFFLFVFFVAYCHAADHNMYHNCSRVEVCSQNRELERLDRYSLVIQGAIVSQGRASFPMKNLFTDEDLFLNVTAVEGNIFRVQIEEAASSRYHLEYVLDGEPNIVNFDSVLFAPNAAFIAVGNRKINVIASPLTLEFYTDDVLQLVLEGDRLTLNNNNLSHPFTFGVKFPQASHLYGLHEHSDRLALRTTAPGGDDPYRVRTMDCTFYEINSTMAMYGAIPALYGHGANSSSGLFLHNAAELWVEITNKDDGGEAYFMADSGAFDLFVLQGPSIVEVVRQFASLVGVAHLPPIWTLGYHQCRWGYADQQDVQTVIADLDTYSFPVDAIWLDIQHTDDMKFFTWNRGNFSDPFDMLRNLSSTHRYLITLSDPHFKVEEGYFVYDEGMARDFFIKNPNETVYEDQCWPGTSVWMDYLNPEARDYYSSLYLYENWNGTTPTLGGIWNDMNEAAIFDEPLEKTFPYDVVHYGGVANREIHNIYGFLQTMATHKGLMDRDNGTIRPFILTRAHFAGSQRYAAFWTGDNTADWPYISISYAMCLTANLLGISFCGADMGGFFNEPSDELLQRWYQAGAWLPFYREHANLGSERREPYLYPEEVQKVIREAMNMRYAHLPVWYTLFYEHTRNGDPVIRPLFYHYPEDTNVFSIDEQLLVGDSIMAKVISEPGVQSTSVYFPGDEDTLWFPQDLQGAPASAGFADVPVDISKIPVYYRRGSIIPLKLTVRPSTTDMKEDPYTLYVFPDQNSEASGTVYIDDTSSFEYRNSMKYNYLKLTYDGTNVTVSSIDDSNSEGFELVIETVVVTTPTELKDGCVKKVYDKSADGVLLSSIKMDGKKLISLKLE